MKKKSLALYLSYTVVITAAILLFLNHPFLAPLSFVFSLFLPGLLALLTIKKSIIFTWPSSLYAFGLGILTLIVSSLIINSIGNALEISAPLNKQSIIIGQGLVSISLLLLYRRWNEIPIRYSIPKFTNMDITIVLFAVVILIGIIAGTVQLNNGASKGIITVLGYSLIPIIVLFLIYKREKLSQNSIITTLWILGLGVLLSGWLRSSYISGPDISLEYALAEKVIFEGAWHIDTIKNAYNACLSVVLLIPSLTFITGFSTTLIMKIVMPVIFSAIIPVVYLICKKYLGVVGAILTTLFFISQPSFIAWWWTPIRQQVAFLFFSLIILVVINSAKRTKPDTILILLFGIGLIVAHYSTAFLSILFFGLTWLLVGLSHRLGFVKKSHFNYPVSGKVILLLLVSFFLWYSQIAFGFNGFVSFGIKSLSNITQIASLEGQAAGQDIFSHFNVFSKQGQSTVSFDDYVEYRNESSANKFNSNNLYSQDSDEGLVRIFVSGGNSEFSQLIESTRKIIIISSKILIIVSVMLILLLSLKNNKYRKYITLAIPALIILLFSVILPSFSVNYDQVRTYQQMLIVLGGLYGIVLFVKQKYRRFTTAFVAIFTILYFMFIPVIPLAFTNEPKLPMNISNYGVEHDLKYTYKSDIVAGTWLSDNNDTTQVIAGDDTSRDRLRLTLGLSRSNTVINGLVPSSLPINSYVFKSSTNSNQGLVYSTYKNDLIIYNFPSEFMASEKNIIYSNGTNKVYK